MFCFEVLLNGKKLCLAGVGESGVLSVMVSWVRPSPKSPGKRGRRSDGQADLHVGGLFDPEPHVHAHARWVQRGLKPGDEVSIRLVHENDPDHAKEIALQTDDETREHERKYYLRLKKKFEGGQSGASPDQPSVSRKTRTQNRRRSKKWGLST
jgi:hypothetical protein